MSVPHPEPSRPRVPRWWRFAGLLLRPRVARALARLADGYLTETGWLRSAAAGEVVNARGEPVPWATCPFIEFIAPRLRPEWGVFEYGAGASTRFYAARVADVRAVEHDAAFAARLRPLLPANARVAVRPEGSDEYLAEIAAMAAPPEIVCIDGRDRVRCAAFAIRHAAPAGVIVFDDTERPQYAPALAVLAAAGFRRIEFWGMSPGSELHRATTIFYRPENVLGI